MAKGRRYNVPTYKQKGGFHPTNDPIFHKKHHEAIAQLLGRSLNNGESLTEANLQVVKAFVEMFTKDNTNFNAPGFLKMVHNHSGFTPELEELLPE